MKTDTERSRRNLLDRIRREEKRARGMVDVRGYEFASRYIDDLDNYYKTAPRAEVQYCSNTAIFEAYEDLKLSYAWD